MPQIGYASLSQQKGVCDMKPKVGIVNPVAKAMLQERKAPQVIPPKKGNKRKLTKKEKQNALRDEKLY